MAEFIPPEFVDHEDITQAGAVPYRVAPTGEVEVCLVTSSVGYWSLPKGTIEPGDTAEETAVTESFEEAGLLGVVAEPPLGVWRYLKNSRPTYVLFFPMLVTGELETWLEHDRRDRRWVPLDEAAPQIERPGMDHAVHALAERLACASGD